MINSQQRRPKNNLFFNVLIISAVVYQLKSSIQYRIQTTSFSWFIPVDRISVLFQHCSNKSVEQSFLSFSRMNSHRAQYPNIAVIITCSFVFVKREIIVFLTMYFHFSDTDRLQSITRINNYVIHVRLVQTELKTTTISLILRSKKVQDANKIA